MKKYKKETISIIYSLIPHATMVSYNWKETKCYLLLSTPQWSKVIHDERWKFQQPLNVYVYYSNQVVYMHITNHFYFKYMEIWYIQFSIQSISSTDNFKKRRIKWFNQHGRLFPILLHQEYRTSSLCVNRWISRCTYI